MNEKVRHFFRNKIVTRILVGLCITIATLFLELFVFNYRAFIGRGQSVDIAPSEITYRHMSKAEDYSEEKASFIIDTDQMPSVTIKFGEEKEIKTIASYITFENPDIYKYELGVDGYFNSDNNRVKTTSYRSLEYINGLETSRYFEPEFNHAVDTIVLRFNSIDHLEDNGLVGLKLTIEKFTFNYNIPFYFSLVRFISLNVVCGGVYLFSLLFIDRRREWIKKGKPKINVKKLVLDITVYSIPVVGIIFLFGFYGNFMHSFSNVDYGTQISKELVDAFMKGQTHLDIEVSEELAALKNPYDPSARYGVEYAWDHLFYNGKYYSYYGIAPVFMLFKRYLYDAYGVLLFTIIGLAFMALSYESMIKQMKKKKEIPLFLKYSLFLLLALGCGAIFQVVRPYFYEVSTSCAYMCMMISLYHIIRSGIIFENPQKRKWLFYYHLAFSSVWLGLAVLSRATFALYALAHVVILAYYFFKKKFRVVSVQYRRNSVEFYIHIAECITI